jgi:hypothetical protein
MGFDDLPRPLDDQRLRGMQSGEISGASSFIRPPHQHAIGLFQTFA